MSGISMTPFVNLILKNRRFEQAVTKYSFKNKNKKKITEKQAFQVSFSTVLCSLALLNIRIRKSSAFEKFVLQAGLRNQLLKTL
jgi:hypothetical protein